MPEKNTIDIQGHRGCRGLMPENTVPAFIEALAHGVRTLELDVCITKDSLVVVSHEPWLNYDICTIEDSSFNAKTQMNFNLFAMTYKQIKNADCGSKPHPRFPQQTKLAVSKPLLAEVFNEVKNYCEKEQIPLPFFNIESKMHPDGDNLYHPEPEVFCSLVLDCIKNNYPLDKIILQSFDYRALEIFKNKLPQIPVAALVENNNGVIANLDRLSFKPEIYSPYFKLLDTSSIMLLKQMEIKIIPWTVNEKEDIKKMLSMGIDGIISDYPDRVQDVLKEKHKSQ